MVELLCSYSAARKVHLLAHSGDIQAAVFAANPKLADDPGALSNAAGSGHESFIRLMLRYEPELAKRADCIRFGIGPKTRAVAELLFKNGLNPSHPNWLLNTPLHEFARRGDVESAGVYIEHGAGLDARDEDACSTPLCWAAKFGQLNIVELLLKQGARPNLPDDPPWATPIQWAIRRRHPEIVDVLTNHGAV